LLPAVQAARESGRRTACFTNVSQLGLAAAQHDSVKSRLPGYLNQSPVANHSSGGTSSYCCSWPVAIMPFMERADVAAAWGTGAAAPLINSLICASTQPNGVPDRLTYAANAGTGRNDYDGVMVDTVPRDLTPSRRSKSLQDIAERDGCAKTLLFAEKSGAGVILSRWTVPSVTITANASRSPEVAPDWNTFFPVWPLFGIYSTSVPSPVLNNPVCSGFAPSSSHSGGVVFGFCDGSTRFVTNSLNPGVYAHLVTSYTRWNGSTYASNSDDAKVWLLTAPSNPYVLSDSDF
jgi:hypothetical protein